ncbi:MAG: peptide ABC transporter substrate-binding protein, partial [Treponema sp.]|nr:peptide ABC transporter substrate-binding protein [Treponema sp.]
SNGEPVTADDFVYGWQRAVDPATKSEYAFLLSDIAQVKNAGAIMAGQMDPNQLGVRAVDDYTFEVRLTVPVSFFDQLLYFCTFYPANKKFIESVGDKYATSPETFLSNGAFILTEYKPEAKNITLVKNTAYYDASRVKLAGLKYTYVNNGEEALQKYQSGQLDLVELDGAQVKTQKSSPDFKAIDSGFLFYLAFNLDLPKFSSLNLRRAISLAFDREIIAEEIADGSIASYACVPKGYAFNSKGEDFTPSRIEFPDVCSYNPKLAKECYAKAQAETGKKSFDIEFLVADLDAQRIAALSIKRQVEALLPGVRFNIKLVPKSERRKAMVAHKFELGLTNWGPDYADPMTYLAMWVTGNDNNHGNYMNPQYNALISSCTDGDLCTRPEERWAALKRAETMVMEDVAVVPVYQQCNADLIKPNVKGIAFHAVAINRIYKHATK